MPGMSPRTKSRKGRFGIGGLTPPTISITSHVNDDAVTTTPTFIAVANDDLNGDVSASIVWSFTVDTGQDGLTGGTVNPTLTATTQDVQASITSGGETTVATITGIVSS